MNKVLPILLSAAVACASVCAFAAGEKKDETKMHKHGQMAKSHAVKKIAMKKDEAKK